ncbi:hypothetical protein NECAME_11144 [Necator americanus]|uniref:Uncharacterized protein n=1 Tax=Necator americanus TaxID=51031 RepID=W2T814_NECAM|nr:hypothetical protein NECAME_11144 [Necator americanus]ETN77291.1 hypothetical protein NECAME_11144 [Necator americanus]
MAYAKSGGAFTGVALVRLSTVQSVNKWFGMENGAMLDGVGNSHYFYINHVFALAGTTAGWIFLLGILVSDSLLGGLVAVLAFAFNHGEATRVQWTPPLRESFAFPMIIAQIAVVTYILKWVKISLVQ